MSGRVGEHHYGPERPQSAERRAEALIAAALKQAKLKELDLKRRRKGDPWKVALAQQLRRETEVPLKWIAKRLAMGTWTYLNNRLYWARREGKANA